MNQIIWCNKLFYECHFHLFSPPDNAIPIKSWFSDPSDTALLNLLPMLDALRYKHFFLSHGHRNLLIMTRPINAAPFEHLSECILGVGDIQWEK